MRRLKIAVTMGDPAGIGPEITAKLLLIPEVNKKASVTVIGDLTTMIDTQRRVSNKLSIKPVASFDEKTKKGVINLFDMKRIKYGEVPLGAETKKGGRAQYLYVKKAIEAALKGEVDAIVTAPINKHALHMAGIMYPGHTEIMAEETGVKNFGMMLICPQLKVMLVTTHTSLKSVSGLLTIKKVLEKIELAHAAMKNDFGIKAPKIAVLGLNPHSGEAGAFGDEEIKIINPAIKAARKKGIDAQGPYPPDTIFGKLVHKKSHDIAVCMYHDQGLIPLKLIGFESGVNVTLGLPIVRTSPDHGTAYDIAGTGIASAESMLTAFNTAVVIAQNRMKGGKK